MSQIFGKTYAFISNNSPFASTNLNQEKVTALKFRIKCLLGPLNICLIESAYKITSVQNIISQAQETISNACDYIEQSCAQSEGLDKSQVSRALDDYIRDLDFLVSALNCALILGSRCDNASTNTNQLSRSRSRPSIASILRASHRITAVRNRSMGVGELGLVSGTLYWRRLQSDDTQVDSWTVALQNCRIRLMAESTDQFTLKIECVRNEKKESPEKLTLRTERVGGVQHKFNRLLNFDVNENVDNLRLTTLSEVSNRNEGLLDATGFHFTSRLYTVFSEQASSMRYFSDTDDIPFQSQNEEWEIPDAPPDELPRKSGYSNQALLTSRDFVFLAGVNPCEDSPLEICSIMKLLKFEKPIKGSDYSAHLDATDEFFNSIML